MTGDSKDECTEIKCLGEDRDWGGGEKEKKQEYRGEVMCVQGQKGAQGTVVGAYCLCVCVHERELVLLDYSQRFFRFHSWDKPIHSHTHTQKLSSSSFFFFVHVR